MSVSFTPVVDVAKLEVAESQPLAVIFKHSFSCSISVEAHSEVKHFAEDHPEVPIYLIDVIQEREISRGAADRYGVRHESPQVIVLRDGRPVWDASHYGVTARDIAGQL